MYTLIFKTRLAWEVNKDNLSEKKQKIAGLYAEYASR